MIAKATLIQRTHHERTAPAPSISLRLATAAASSTATWRVRFTTHALYAADGMRSAAGVVSGGPYQQFAPPRPQIVHVVSKPGGLARAFGFIFGLFLFAAVFIIGIVFGMAALSAASDADSVVVRQTYRDGNSNTIAIIPVDGVIDERQSEFIRAAVQNVLNDNSVAPWSCASFARRRRGRVGSNLV